MEYERSAHVATAEGLELEMELAGMGSRGSARVIDFGIQAVILIAAGFVFSATVDDSEVAEAVLAIIGVVGTFLILWGYDTLFEAFNSGQTPGKRRLSIRVVSDSGSGITFRQAAIRSILRIVDEGTLLLGALFSIARSPKNKRLGDMAAGTLVIRTGDAEEIEREDIALREASWQTLQEAQGWDTTGVDAEDAEVVRQYLTRRPQIPPRRRRELAGALAERLQPRVPGSESVRDPEVFLEVLATLKARRG